MDKDVVLRTYNRYHLEQPIDQFIYLRDAFRTATRCLTYRKRENDDVGLFLAILSLL